MRLKVRTNSAKRSDLRVSLVPFHRSSPVLKYLHALSSILQDSRVFDLISLPLLKDLTFTISGINDDVINLYTLLTAAQLTSPAFTGTLQWIVALVVGCSCALAFLTITCYLRGTFVFFPPSACNSSSSVGD